MWGYCDTEIPNAGRKGLYLLMLSQDSKRNWHLQVWVYVDDIQRGDWGRFTDLCTTDIEIAKAKALLFL